MIQIPAQASVFVMHESVNFRKGIDGMAGLARVVLQVPAPRFAARPGLQCSLQVRQTGWKSMVFC